VTIESVAVTMSLRVGHVFAAAAGTNSGDFMIGVAYKRYFRDVILKNECSSIEFVDLDCRDQKLFNSPKAIDAINRFDYIIVGGGGLLLPDSAPNCVSCWQWVIDENWMQRITTPIYVLGIGFNTFYGQTMAMPHRTSNQSDTTRLPILQRNFVTLLRKAKLVTMRHKADIDDLTQLLGQEHTSTVQYEPCATQWYVRTNWGPTMPPPTERRYIAIEVKDDRPWRRYHKIGKSVFYQALCILVETLRARGREVAYLSHDGSRSFHKYLVSKGIQIAYLDNAIRNEQHIKSNYSVIHTLFSMAGHSQIIGDACDIRVIGLVTHPKVRRFCDDCGSDSYVMVNDHLTSTSLAQAMLNTYEG
jgi:hypothetical protein